MSDQFRSLRAGGDPHGGIPRRLEPGKPAVDAVFARLLETGPDRRILEGGLEIEAGLPEVLRDDDDPGQGRVRGAVIGILIGHGIDTAHPGGVHHLDDVLNLALVLERHRLLVPDLGRNPGPFPNGNALFVRPEEPLDRVANVGVVDPPIRRDHLGEFDDFVGVGKHSRLVHQPGRKADGPQLHPFLDEPLHPCQLVRRGRPLGVPHDGPANPVMPDVERHVRPRALPRDRVDDPTHHVGRVAAVGAPQHRRDPLADHPLVEAALGPDDGVDGVGVHVDEPRCQDQSGRGDSLASRPGSKPAGPGHVGDPAILDADVPEKSRSTRSIDDPGAGNDQIERVDRSGRPLRGERRQRNREQQGEKAGAHERS